MLNIKKGNIVRLREPVQGRLFKGRVIAVNDREITVSLLNGLEATYPADKWELVGSETSNGSSDMSDD